MDHHGMIGTTGHAVVIGGSMAGLVAARVLAERFAHVTVVERDRIPEGPLPRKGVPQARHAHGLLAGGRRGLDRMFPGFSESLIARGALDGDILNDSRWFGHGVELAREPSALRGLLASRPLIEDEVRRRIAALPNVMLRQATAVAGLQTDGAGRRVVGVRLERERGKAGPSYLPADLVVDATGRGSRSPAWLSALGYQAPHEERIEIGISYTSRVYARRGGLPNGSLATIVSAGAPSWRFGVALAMEEDRLIVTQGGYFGEAAPNDEQGFSSFARSLEFPAIAELLDGALAVSDFTSFRFPGSQRRRYERLGRFPDGYLVLGDALCSFNPVYGQGMTAAVLQAEALMACLAEGRADLAQRFFAAAAKVIDTPWQIAAGADFGHPRLAGQVGLVQRMMNGYIKRLYRSAGQDARLSTEFLSVANLVAPPSRLFAPSVVLAVAKGWLSCPRSLARAAPGNAPAPVVTPAE
jgi:2-polyprenyl-6-methoxyphenol hydroxylase-like FAD-dependent oxidoreductase